MLADMYNSAEVEETPFKPSRTGVSGGLGKPSTRTPAPIVSRATTWQRVSKVEVPRKSGVSSLLNASLDGAKNSLQNLHANDGRARMADLSSRSITHAVNVQERDRKPPTSATRPAVASSTVFGDDHDPDLFDEKSQAKPYKGQIDLISSDSDSERVKGSSATVKSKAANGAGAVDMKTSSSEWKGGRGSSKELRPALPFVFIASNKNLGCVVGGELTFYSNGDLRVAFVSVGEEKDMTKYTAIARRDEKLPDNNNKRVVTFHFQKEHMKHIIYCKGTIIVNFAAAAASPDLDKLRGIFGRKPMHKESLANSTMSTIFFIYHKGGAEVPFEAAFEPGLRNSFFHVRPPARSGCVVNHPKQWKFIEHAEWLPALDEVANFFAEKKPKSLASHAPAKVMGASTYSNTMLSHASTNASKHNIGSLLHNSFPPSPVPIREPPRAAVKINPEELWFIYPDVPHLCEAMKFDPSFIPPPQGDPAARQAASDDGDAEPEYIGSVKKPEETPQKPQDTKADVLPQRKYTRVTTVSITAGDILRLQPRSYLNDSCIDWWFQYIYWRTLNHHPHRQKLHCYSSFFYRKLSSGRTSSDAADKALAAWKQVSRWTAEVDIFSKKIAFVPINDSLHWSLAILCNLDELDAGLTKAMNEGLTGAAAKALWSRYHPCIVFMDSLGCHSQRKVCQELRDYLLHEWISRKSGFSAADEKVKHLQLTWKEMRDIKPAIPQQRNTYDCGIYICLYAHGWLMKWQDGEFYPNEADSRQVHGIHPQKQTQQFRGVITPSWFSMTDADNFRKELQKFAWDVKPPLLHAISQPRVGVVEDAEKPLFAFSSIRRPATRLVTVPSSPPKKDDSGADDSTVDASSPRGGAGKITKDADDADKAKTTPTKDKVEDENTKPASQTFDAEGTFNAQTVPEALGLQPSAGTPITFNIPKTDNDATDHSATSPADSPHEKKADDDVEMRNSPPDDELGGPPLIPLPEIERDDNGDESRGSPRKRARLDSKEDVTTAAVTRNISERTLPEADCSKSEDAEPESKHSPEDAKPGKKRRRGRSGKRTEHIDD